MDEINGVFFCEDDVSRDIVSNVDGTLVMKIDHLPGTKTYMQVHRRNKSGEILLTEMREGETRLIGCKPGQTLSVVSGILAKGSYKFYPTPICCSEK